MLDTSSFADRFLQDTICRDPFYKVMPAYFGMTLKELIAVKHPTAWVQFEKGETTQDDLFRDFFKDGRPFDHEAFLGTVVGCHLMDLSTEQPKYLGPIAKRVLQCCQLGATPPGQEQLWLPISN